MVMIKILEITCCFNDNVEVTQPFMVSNKKLYSESPPVILFDGSTFISFEALLLFLPFNVMDIIKKCHSNEGSSQLHVDVFRVLLSFI